MHLCDLPGPGKQSLHTPRVLARHEVGATVVQPDPHLWARRQAARVLRGVVGSDYRGKPHPLAEQPCHPSVKGRMVEPRQVHDPAEHIPVPQTEVERAIAAGTVAGHPARQAVRDRTQQVIDAGRHVDRQVGLDVLPRSIDALAVVGPRPASPRSNEDYRCPGPRSPQAGVGGAGGSEPVNGGARAAVQQVDHREPPGSLGEVLRREVDVGLVHPKAAGRTG